VEGSVGLGHRRLSIIDLEAGKQPMTPASGQATIIFNGEIYNYPDLREQLLREGYPFRTHSDTEVILALYEREGAEGIRHLAGMFAFALWDHRKHTLLLARDRAGMKPLYYAIDRGQLFFSSEIKAIREACPHLDEIDRSAVNFYFSRQYIGGNATIFSQIKKVEPGTWLEIGTDGKIRRQTYWQLTPKPSPQTDMEEAVKLTGNLLNEAVRSHLVSDVPVGVFLSGGLDSSTLLSYAVENSEPPLQTFSVGFGEQHAYNETHFARQLAGRYGTIHHEIQVTEKEVLDCLPHIIRHLDEPLADYAILPTYVMSRFAAQHVKVVLSGEGADELFGGYKRYHAYALLDRLGAGHFLEKWLPSPCVFKPCERKKLLAPEVFLEDEWLPQEQQMHHDKAYFSPAGNVNSMLYTDMRNWLVDDLLMKVDKMGMLASLEARIPYLDHRLVEHVAALDGRLKVSLREKKRLLRQIATKRLPPEIFNRPKHGFTVPVGEWLRGDLKSLFEETVLADPGNARWFDLAYLRRLFESHLRGKNYRLQLWALLVFCLWQKEGEH
jgi:asparagine synthase (glutamine-hydrolysing)